MPFVQQRLGYKIIPINPMLKEVLNEPAYPSLAAVNVPVDVVQVFRSKDQVIPVAEESTPTLCAPHRGPRRALQLTLCARSLNAQQRCRTATVSAFAPFGCRRASSPRMLRP